MVISDREQYYITIIGVVKVRSVTLLDVNPRNITLSVVRVPYDVEKPDVNELIHFWIYVPLNIPPQILNQSLLVLQLYALDCPFKLFFCLIDADEYASTLFVKKSAVEFPKGQKQVFRPDRILVVFELDCFGLSLQYLLPVNELFFMHLDVHDAITHHSIELSQTVVYGHAFQYGSFLPFVQVAVSCKTLFA